MLQLLGIRPLRPDIPLTDQQAKSVRIDAIIAAMLFVITLATRFYRLNKPPSIGMYAI